MRAVVEFWLKSLIGNFTLVGLHSALGEMIVQLGSLLLVLAIPGPRCEGRPSGGMGDATTDDPSLQCWSMCIPFLLGKCRNIHSTLLYLLSGCRDRNYRNPNSKDISSCGRRTRIFMASQWAQICTLTALLYSLLTNIVLTSFPVALNLGAKVIWRIVSIILTSCHTNLVQKYWWGDADE